MAGYQLSYSDPDGHVYALTDGVTTFLQPGGLHGFGVIRVEPASARRPYRDGVWRIGPPYTPAREMQIALAILANSYSEWVARQRALARAVSAYKNIDELGTLRIVAPDGATRYIDCWLVEWPDPEMTGPLFGIVTPTFWAPEPWFYDPTPETLTIALTNPGGITFPITFPITFTSTTIDTTCDIENTGDVATWPVVRVNGPGANITIENETTGHKIAFTGGTGLVMANGDYIDIDMADGTVSWWDDSAGEFYDATEYLSVDSEYWPLERGVNTIHITMTAASTGSMIISYYHRYHSV